MSDNEALYFTKFKNFVVGDPSLAWSWHCNIAVAFVDEGGDHKLANRAAARFMQLCFGVDTSDLPEYEKLKEDWSKEKLHPL